MKKRILFLGFIAGFVFQLSAQNQMSVEVARNFIKQYPNPDTIHWRGNLNHFDWQAGYMMFVMEKMWKATSDTVFFNYVKRYVDQQVDEQGNIPDFKPDALDHFIPGYAILFMYEQTGLEKYKIAAQTVRNGFKAYPRNSDGGFWHSVRMRNQMWVDGVFMGQIFLLRYAKAIGEDSYCYNEVMKQMTVILNNCKKSNGLLLHAYDESRKVGWANKQTGKAPEVWSEGLGWYAVLIADAVSYFPTGSENYNTLLTILQEMCSGLKGSQDVNTGLWCQVVDKCNEPGNWNETSGSGMFTYLIHQSILNKYIDVDVYQPVVEKAYAGLASKMIRNIDGTIDIIDCSSIGVKPSYEHYINCPKEVNTYAGILSFILGTMSIELYPHK